MARKWLGHGLATAALVAMLTAVPYRMALASPATETDFYDIRDGFGDINLSASYQTDLVFRGVRQADDVLRLKLKGRVGAGPVDLLLGVASAVPFEGSNAGIDEPREINVFLKARFNLVGKVVAEAGLTYYAFVGAETVPGAETESAEVFFGARLPIILPFFARLYYDLEFQNVTIETEARWRQPILGDRLALELSGKAGYVHIGEDGENILAAQAGARTAVERETATGMTIRDNRAYYEVGAALTSKLTKHAKVGANMTWTGTTGEFLFGGRTDDETLYGGITLTLSP